MIRFSLQRVALFLFAALLMGSTALAQSQNDDPGTDTSPEELEKVAEVLIQIEDIRKQYAKKIRNTKDRVKIVSYKRQMSLKIDRAIARHEGISIERYEEITNAAQSDTELKQKILTLTKQKQGKTKSANKSR